MDADNIGMILSFKEQFVNKILNGSKTTTIREDKHNRWKVGREIQLWKGSPRNKGSFQFSIGICEDVRLIQIDPVSKIILLQDQPFFVCKKVDVSLIYNKDGFDNEEEFWKWFNKPFNGRLITFKLKD